MWLIQSRKLIKEEKAQRKREKAELKAKKRKRKAYNQRMKERRKINQVQLVNDV